MSVISCHGVGPTEVPDDELVERVLALRQSLIGAIQACEAADITVIPASCPTYTFHKDLTPRV